MDEHDNHQAEHGHSHSHDISSIKGINLILVVLLNFIITVAELIGGIYSGSLSLLSDALHNFSDGIAIVISYIAMKIAGKEKDEQKTFGYKRTTILAALLNSIVLIAISIFLFKEAYLKFVHPQPVNGSVVIWVALLGLIANFIGVLLLQKAKSGDLNIRSSYLHLLSDALSSLGVLIGGIIIYYFNMYWVDPLLTVLIGLYVMKESFEIVQKSLNILIQGVPEEIDVVAVAQDLQQIAGVENVHHVHVWSLDERNINFEAHVNIEDRLVSATREMLKQIEHRLLHYGITHTTIQFEYNCCTSVGIINK
jgi:cobalt-zinc-cadmium efflux system protein